MDDQPPNPTLDYSNLNPNIHVRIVLSTIMMKLIRKGVITSEEAGEMANEINELCRVAIETLPSTRESGDFRDQP